MAYMKKLAAQKPDFRRGHTLMLQILAAGEYPVNVISYGHHVEYMKAQGAPLGWSADEPVTATGGATSLAKHAPHPEAAKLFIDFLMSKEAQEVITRFNRIATRVDVPPNPPRLLKGLELAPVKPELGKILPKRIKQFREIFGIRRGRPLFERPSRRDVCFFQDASHYDKELGSEIKGDCNEAVYQCSDHDPVGEFLVRGLSNRRPPGHAAFWKRTDSPFGRAWGHLYHPELHHGLC